MITIALCNQKGGVGKTTTAQNIAVELSSRGRRILIIDLDPQGTLSLFFGLQRDEEHTSLSVLEGSKTSPFHSSTVDILSSNEGQDLATIGQAGSPGAMEYVKNLKSYLTKKAHYYDFCIIDTSPYIGQLMGIALSVSDYVLIPTLAEVASIHSIKGTLSAIEGVRHTTNKRLKVLGVVLNNYNPRLSISKTIADNLDRELSKAYGIRVFDSPVRASAAIKSSQAYGQPVREYNPRSNPTKDYQSLVDEILETIDNA